MASSLERRLLDTSRSPQGCKGSFLSSRRSKRVRVKYPGDRIKTYEQACGTYQPCRGTSLRTSGVFSKAMPSLSTSAERRRMRDEEVEMSIDESVVCFLHSMH